jgi:hypothetical protein
MSSDPVIIYMYIGFMVSNLSDNRSILKYILNRFHQAVKFTCIFVVEQIMSMNDHALSWIIFINFVYFSASGQSQSLVPFH